MDLPMGLKPLNMFDSGTVRHALPCGCSWGAFKPATYCEEGDMVHGLLSFRASSAGIEHAGRQADEYFHNAMEGWREHFGARRTPEYCRRHRR